MCVGALCARAFYGCVLMYVCAYLRVCGCVCVCLSVMCIGANSCDGMVYVYGTCTSARALMFSICKGLPWCRKKIDRIRTARMVLPAGVPFCPLNTSSRVESLE